jgi:hypothetical protein
MPYPWLLMGQIKKKFWILSIQTGRGGLGLKTIYCPFKILVRGLTPECICVTVTNIIEQYTIATKVTICVTNKFLNH